MPAMTIKRWLGVRLEFLGSCLMLSTAFASVSAQLVSNSVDAGLVGLLMTYTISVTGTLVGSPSLPICVMLMPEELVGAECIRVGAEHRFCRTCPGLFFPVIRGCRRGTGYETPQHLACRGYN